MFGLKKIKKEIEEIKEKLGWRQCSSYPDKNLESVLYIIHDDLELLSDRINELEVLLDKQDNIDYATGIRDTSLNIGDTTITATFPGESGINYSRTVKKTDKIE